MYWSFNKTYDKYITFTYQIRRSVICKNVSCQLVNKPVTKSRFKHLNFNAKDTCTFGYIKLS